MLRNQEIGRQRIKEILGYKSEQLIQMFAEISPDFANYIVEFAYGDLYNRPGISDKTREVAAVSCLIGQGNTGLALKAHFRGMLNVGWTPNEVIELLIFLIGYNGFPSIVSAIVTFKEILDEDLKK